ncbi:4-hydroxyphenylacetate 3-monooxygenase, oxygenase component [Gloeothece verrucosa]|uniref:4-hydroxyphenylacetate 3-monooxygenase, oxygenase subunit n=1 Tax=Gloeothece verrucosa (strain PCC 7822) TaxID=497965 RepID=E0ULN8_GLOV7|nr:4-hydroxyphenylacetate 3-monooxygenase, oxygenase component [Gloeothece verrucosa]ADN17868.1 4-hydroxyphenylacetate 3-monooxygenase, oxygenase subunit [Gloeothece verrucosa PCC 7822]
MTIRTGAQYKAGLKNYREVWIEGQKIDDVTTHYAFTEPIASIASLYDKQHQPELSEILTYSSPDTNNKTSTFFLTPVTHDHLLKRRMAIKTYADATFGLMGRSPDFLNTAVMAFAAAKDFFGQVNSDFADNILTYYNYCQENDVFLSCALVNPQVDRSKASGEQKDPYAHLRVVQETADGLLVRGAKMISTLAPLADELFVFPLPGLKPGDEPYALAFSIPINTPGLRLICRESFSRTNQSLFDHPLSSRFEEIDAACVFDDVLIPWERVFFYGNVELANVLYAQTNARNYTSHQGAVRALAKAELLVGIAIALAEMAKTNSFLHVQEMLGELLGYLELVKGAVLLSEREAQKTPWGTLCPAIEPLVALRYHFPRMNARMVEVIQTLGAGGLISCPMEQDFNTPIGADIERYFRGTEVSAQERLHLLKLAWDVTGDAFGQRQLLYERYHAGDPVRIAAGQYREYDKLSLLKRVESALKNSCGSANARN